MDIFATYKQLSSNDTVLRLVHCQKKIFDDYILYTYTVNVPKNKFEDDIYAANPTLLRILPRACSILVHDGSIVTTLEGPTKFSGRTNIDEDPEEGQDENKNSGIYNHAMVIEWAKKQQLEIVETEKANGKFAICKIFNHLTKQFILCGSKNNHILTTFDQIESLLTNKNEIMDSVLIDIRNNYEKLISLSNWFNDGYSIVGELCDGQHFTDGDNTISWFGLFRNGIPLNDHACFSILKESGLKSVSYSTVFTPENDVSQLENVFLASRCKPNEGSVLRCRNISTPDTVVLVKTKSIIYIVKRFTRQILLRGYKDIERLRDRFVDAQDYHGLSTEASIRITRQLYDFCMWMMEKKYPGTVLGHQVVNSVRGQLPNGFNTYWKQFLEEGNKDMVVTPADFGHFEKDEYLSNTILYQKRTYDNPAIVVFLQGLQGSGKSTIGDYCSVYLSNKGFATRAEYIEQDMYWSDTVACQGALYHMIASASGPKIIFVTRCNMNPQQYSRYLDICHRLPTVVTFFSPQTVDPLYFMISMAGIMTRSSVGDRLMVGRFDLPIRDVVTFSRTNYDGYVEQNQFNKYTTFESDTELLEASKKVFCDTKGRSPSGETYTDTIIQFVRDHQELLMSRRLPIEQVCVPILQTVRQLLDGSYTIRPYIVCPSKPIYIGAAVSVFDRGILESILDTHSTTGVTYLHHMTTHFYEKGKSPLGAYDSLNPKDCERPLGTSLNGKSPLGASDPILPGQKLERMINALVIRKSDGACAFRITPQPDDTNDKKYTSGRNLQQSPEKTYHITARIPADAKPMISNSFVGLTDDSVQIIQMSIPIKLTGFHYQG